MYQSVVWDNILHHSNLQDIHHSSSLNILQSNLNILNNSPNTHHLNILNNNLNILNRDLNIPNILNNSPNILHRDLNTHITTTLEIQRPELRLESLEDWQSGWLSALLKKNDITMDITIIMDIITTVKVLVKELNMT